MLTEVQKKVLKYIIQILKENNIQFQITGGLAVILYGGKKDLFDIDIDIYKKDFPKIKELFKEYIKEDYHQNKGKHFENWTMVFEIDEVMVDFGQAEDCFMFDKKEERIDMSTDLSHPTIVDFEGMELSIEPKDELISYKQVLSRETDLIDIEQII